MQNMQRAVASRLSSQSRGTTAPGAQYVLMTVDGLVTLLGGTTPKETP